MKKILAISVLLNVAFVAGVSWKELTAHAASGGAPAGNGDVNGDGTIDISDAVYTLSWLFTSGPAAVAIECPPPVVKGLPATGQTKCYGRGTESPCEGSFGCMGQDGFYQVGCPTEGRFVDHGDGTVTDNCTGLMWQKDTADTNGDSQIDDADGLQWCDALGYCENLNFALHDDWRLPNVRELQSIVDYGSLPAIDPVFGALSSNTSYYWSSTTYVYNPEVKWRVHFSQGFIDGNNEVSLHLVRAVRSGP